MNGKAIFFCVACSAYFYVSLMPHVCGEKVLPLKVPQTEAAAYWVNPNPSTCVPIEEKHDHTVENDYSGQQGTTTYTTTSGTASGASVSTTTTL